MSEDHYIAKSSSFLPMASPFRQCTSSDYSSVPLLVARSPVRKMSTSKPRPGRSTHWRTKGAHWTSDPNTSFTPARTSKHSTPTPYSTASSTSVLKYAPASEVPTGMCFDKFNELSVEMVSLMFAINSCPPWFPMALFGSVAPFAFK